MYFIIIEFFYMCHHNCKKIKRNKHSKINVKCNMYLKILNSNQNTFITLKVLSFLYVILSENRHCLNIFKICSNNKLSYSV